jgi:hypothetical protein
MPRRKRLEIVFNEFKKEYDEITVEALDDFRRWLHSEHGVELTKAKLYQGGKAVDARTFKNLKSDVSLTIVQTERFA